ncbi:MAG: hypothetical protein FVQ83_13255 [Chloroflexi bacterium]|nr:hypothetical protein [Chloroflexota bacterium]
MTNFSKIGAILIGILLLSACSATVGKLEIRQTELPIGSLSPTFPSQDTLAVSPVALSETNVSPPNTPTASIGPTLSFPSRPTPFIVNSMAEFPGNLANGEAAPDFRAKLLGGGDFSLSDPRSNYLLVFPTVSGCGDCIFGLRQIEFGLEPFPDLDLQILVLSIYAGDNIYVWEYFQELIPHPNIQWGVVESASFVVDYEILTLGPILLIDPQGNLVFRSEYPLAAYQFEKMFELTIQN